MKKKEFLYLEKLLTDNNFLMINKKTFILKQNKNVVVLEIKLQNRLKIFSILIGYHYEGLGSYFSYLYKSPPPSGFSHFLFLKQFLQPKELVSYDCDSETIHSNLQAIIDRCVLPLTNNIMSKWKDINDIISTFSPQKLLPKENENGEDFFDRIKSIIASETGFNSTPQDLFFSLLYFCKKNNKKELARKYYDSAIFSLLAYEPDETKKEKDIMTKFYMHNKKPYWDINNHINDLILEVQNVK